MEGGKVDETIVSYVFHLVVFLRTIVGDGDKIKIQKYSKRSRKARRVFQRKDDIKERILSSYLQKIKYKVVF